MAAVSMNAFEPMFWMTCAAIVLRILNGGNPKAVDSVRTDCRPWNFEQTLHAFFCSGIAVGLLATSARKHFRQPWIWLSVGIAFLCFLPNLLWEIHNGWPTLALFHAVMGTKYVIVSPWEYIWQQTLLTHLCLHPFGSPVCLFCCEIHLEKSMPCWPGRISLFWQRCSSCTEKSISSRRRTSCYWPLARFGLNCGWFHE
jgi:hypothetical protein